MKAISIHIFTVGYVVEGFRYRETEKVCYKEKDILSNVAFFLFLAILCSLEFGFSSLACVLPTDKSNEVMDTGIGDGHHCHWMYFLLSHLH